MSYQADRRVQIPLKDGSAPAERTHEDRGGTALCNIQLRPLRGQPVMFTKLGPGEVTCGNCGRANDQQRLMPLTAPMPSTTVRPVFPPCGA